MLSIQRLGRSCSYRAVSRPHILWEGKELLRGSQPHDSKLLKYTQNKSLSIGFVHDLGVHLRGLKKYSEDRVMAKGCKGNHPQIWLIHLFQLRIYFILVFPGWWRTRKECRDNGSFWGSTKEISWESWVAPLEWGWLAKNDPLDLQVSKGLLIHSKTCASRTGLCRKVCVYGHSRVPWVVWSGVFGAVFIAEPDKKITQQIWEVGLAKSSHPKNTWRYVIFFWWAVRAFTVPFLKGLGPVKKAPWSNDQPDAGYFANILRIFLDPQIDPQLFTSNHKVPPWQRLRRRLPNGASLRQFVTEWRQEQKDEEELKLIFRQVTGRPRSQFFQRRVGRKTASLKQHSV